MSKRKTDEQRAQDWVYMRQPAKATQTDAYLAGLRSERRALKREQAETLRWLLAEHIADREKEPSRNASARIGAIRQCIKALGFSEKE